MNKLSSIHYYTIGFKECEIRILLYRYTYFNIPIGSPFNILLKNSFNFVKGLKIQIMLFIYLSGNILIYLKQFIKFDRVNRAFQIIGIKY